MRSILLLLVIVCTFLQYISAETIDPGHGNPVITIGPNTYTVGYNIVAPTGLLSTQKYYNIIPGNDPTTVIQKALDDLKSKGGGTVIIKADTYLLSTHIFLVSNLRLMGEGMDMTILKLKNYADQFPKSGLLRIRTGSNIIIQDLTVDGNKANQYYKSDTKPNIEYGRYGIFTEGTPNLWFNNVKVTNWQAYGFDPHGWKDQGIWGQYLTITNCIANENNWDGFTLDQSYDIQVHNSEAIHNGRHGFNIVTGSQRVTLSGNTARDNGFYYYTGSSGCGYMAQNNQEKNTDEITLTNNIATNNKKAAFCLNDIQSASLSQNTISTAGYCYELTKTSGTEIRSNTCTANKHYKLTTTILETVEANYTATTEILLTPDNTFTKG